MNKTQLQQLLKQELKPGHYLMGLMGLVLTFMLIHGLIYLRYTSKVINVVAPYTVGELSRMGYQTGSVCLRKYETDLPERHIEGNEYKGGAVDLVTIGDSFSNGGGGGKNPFYQDFIANQYGLKVLNVHDFTPYKEGYIQVALALESSGILDTLKPKAILIETGSRELINRFAKPLAWDVKFSKEQMLSQLAQQKINNVSTQAPNDIFFINSANYKRFTNHIEYTYKPCLTNMVCRMGLTRPLFDVEDANILEFYLDDLRHIPPVTPAAVKLANDNFNHLAELLAKRGIRLYFMPVVDKYDLYSPYLTNTTSPRNPLFELLRPLEKHYTFIDTKAILAPLLAEGEKDVFFPDDTHWSYKASEAIVRHTPFGELHATGLPNM